MHHVRSHNNQHPGGCARAPHVLEQLAAFPAKVCHGEAKPPGGDRGEGAHSHGQGKEPLAPVFILGGSGLRLCLLSLAAAFAFAFDPGSGGGSAEASTVGGRAQRRAQRAGRAAAPLLLASTSGTRPWSRVSARPSRVGYDGYAIALADTLDNLTATC